MKDSMTLPSPSSSVQRKGKKRRRSSTRTEKKRIVEGSAVGCGDDGSSSSSSGGGGGGLFGFLDKINSVNSNTNTSRHTKKHSNGHSSSDVDIDADMDNTCLQTSRRRQKRKRGGNNSNDSNNNSQQTTAMGESRVHINRNGNPPRLSPSPLKRSRCNMEQNDYGSMSVLAGIPPPPPTTPSQKKVSVSKATPESKMKSTPRSASRPKERQKQRRPTNLKNKKHNHCSAPSTAYGSRLNNDQMGSNCNKLASNSNIDSITNNNDNGRSNRNKSSNKKKPKRSEGTKDARDCNASSIRDSNAGSTGSISSNSLEKGVENDEKKGNDNNDDESDKNDPLNLDGSGRTTTTKTKAHLDSQSNMSERIVISPTGSIDSACSTSSSFSLSLSRSLSSESSTSTSTSISASSLSSSLTAATEAMREKVKKGVKIKRRSRYDPPRIGHVNSNSKSNPRLTPKPKTITTTTSSSSSSLSLSSTINTSTITPVKDNKSRNKNNKKQSRIDNQIEKIVGPISHGNKCNKSNTDATEEAPEEKIESNNSLMLQARTRQRRREGNLQRNGHYSSTHNKVNKLSTEDNSRRDNGNENDSMKNDQAELEEVCDKLHQRIKSNGVNDKKLPLGLYNDDDNDFCDESSIVMNAGVPQEDKKKLILARTEDYGTNDGTTAIEKECYDNVKKNEINLNGATSFYDEEPIDFLHDDDNADAAADAEEIQTIEIGHRKYAEGIICTNYEKHKGNLGTINEGRKNDIEEAIENDISTEKNNDPKHANAGDNELDKNTGQATSRAEFNSVLSSLERNHCDNGDKAIDINHEYKLDEKQNHNPPQLKKTVGQVRETTRKRYTLTLARTLNTGRKIILMRPKETQKKRGLIEKSKLSCLLTATTPVVSKKQKATGTLLMQKEKEAAVSLERISQTAAVKTPRKRNNFIGKKPSTAKKPDGNLSRAALAKQLNPNLASALVSKSRKILESKKFYPSPPTRPPSLSALRTMDVHQVTPSLPFQEEKSRTKLSLHEQSVPAQRKELKTNFETKSQCNENGPTTIKSSEVLSYIDSQIKNLQDVKLKIKQLRGKKTEIEVDKLKQLCEAPLVEGILNHHATVEKAESSLASVVVNKPRNYVPWKRGQCTERERSIRSNGESSRPRSQSYKNSINDRKLTDSTRSTSRNRIKSASDKVKGQTMNKGETPTRRATSSIMNDIEVPEKEPILSPYGTTWLEFKLDLSPSDNDDELVDSIQKKRVRGGGNEKDKGQTRKFESENDDSDDSSADSESENSISTFDSQSDKGSPLSYATPRAQIKKVSGMDSLQKLGCNNNIEYYQ